MSAVHDHPPRRRVATPALPPHLLSALSVAALAGLALTARAQSPTQDQAPAAPAAASPAANALPPVVVTGNPLRREQTALPVSRLDGDALLLRRGGTLGETLDGLPGVSSTWFGPNASRPVIRGQDGDRIRVLSNGGASLDASSLSFDHAVPIDPLSVQRLEVLRGPAALLYGGSAVGGVVNAIDNRIPRAPLEGVSGAVDLRLGGAARERGSAALIEAGQAPAAGPGFAVHADVFHRETEDLRVPSFDRPTEGGSERRTRVVNSASEAKGGALGASLVGDAGHLGAAVDTYRNTYGIVAEEDVFVRMRRDQFALDGEWRDLGGPVRSVRGRAQWADYEHAEVEGTGEVGTRFANRGVDTRLELELQPLSLAGGELRTVAGLQTERSRFSALGEEAFVPATRSTQGALFLYDEYRRGDTTLSLGGRVERTRVASAGDGADAEEPRFGEAVSRRFTTGSLAVGAVQQLAPGLSLSGNLARSERAPTFYELYADGVHIATAAYERGDPSLRKERGSHLDVSVAWNPGPWRLQAGAYASRFSNYIGLLRSDEPDVVTDEGETVPVYGFVGVPARLQGVEFEGMARVLDRGAQVDVDARLDLVRGSRRDTGEPLPRLAPLRLTVGTEARHHGWRVRAEAQHAARQSRVPDDDTATAAYTIVNLSLDKKLDLGDAVGPAVAGSQAIAYLRLHNLGNELAYNAASVATVRPLAPLPGRSVSVGLRVDF